MIEVIVVMSMQEYMKGYRDCTADTERQEEGVVSAEEKGHCQWRKLDSYTHDQSL